MTLKYVLPLFAMFAFAVTCGESDAATRPGKGNRTLAIKVNLGRNGDFDRVFAESRHAGNETQVVPLDWWDIETGPGRYEPAVNFLAIADAYYSRLGIPIHIAIRPVHTNQKVLPADLQDLPLDNPKVISRFNLLLDWMATQLPNAEVTTIVIGAEVDVFAWGSSDRWREWIAFYSAVAPHARERFGGAQISCETTHAAFVGKDLQHLRSMHRHSDVIGVSYYPLSEGLGTVKPLETIRADFALALAAVPDKPLVYYQIGYPSSDKLGGSVELQADFVSRVFEVWDEYADRVRMVNFQWMHETPPYGVDEFSRYYQNDDDNFRAFVGSIGLKSWEGEPKPAWERLRQEAAARGFGIAR